MNFLIGAIGALGYWVCLVDEEQSPVSLAGTARQDGRVGAGAWGAFKADRQKVLTWSARQR